ncbi:MULTISPECIES: molybdopterin-binding protein [unclassified Bradyrhizobium]|uniref:molybdopterin-binding protein n=1 Tax=unclassified Bradyrhizobium TaxID=2631580 RepID=UPI00247B157B|nr:MULTISPECIES: molybdopterin-binding protein [unclassified Bradyrhizobium]WGR72057.1 molybdopterin-binding protein [Bradyrhizobium sp. ISRA426]WGR76891.1 molybdopterin-binding protein [Bradyrhizobium sp. ISRA430]WGR87296.1 molybdopterin-binding protein [Bradyrhizobium sp. ISRA432]
MSKIKIMSNRRRFLGQLGAGASLVTLGGCDAFDGVLGLGHPALGFLRKANALTMGAQRAIQGPATMAREYPPSAIRQDQRPNGSTDPQTDDYLAVQKDDFAGYRLQVTGLVDKPLSLSLNELRQMPSRTQITRHDCVEGWSCIAQWTGVQLSRVLDRAGIKPAARYVVFHCYDSMDDTLGDDSTLYYESIDLISAYHPQTILAYGLNGQTLPIANGAPLRVRIEQQLGYKMAKYIRAIEIVDSFAKIAGGNGGYWEDRGYDWYAGS